MSAREDLLLVAERLAVQARVHVDPPKPKGEQPPMLSNHGAAATLAHGAKAALEAAQLVDAEPAPIIAAAFRLSDRLTELGVEADIEVAAQLGAAEAIDAVTDLVGGMVAVARRASGAQGAYRRLQTLCERLEAEFAEAGTETSKRIAGRLNTALEDAQQAVQAASRGEGRG
jgi:hypothetical protein